MNSCTLFSELAKGSWQLVVIRKLAKGSEQFSLDNWQLAKGNHCHFKLYFVTVNSFLPTPFCQLSSFLLIENFFTSSPCQLPFAFCLFHYPFLLTLSTLSTLNTLSTSFIPHQTNQIKSSWVRTFFHCQVKVKSHIFHKIFLHSGL
jgi:hypothetical protein